MVVMSLTSGLVLLVRHIDDVCLVEVGSGWLERLMLMRVD
jgi:hypothetical protein